MARKRLLTYSSDGRWRRQFDGKMEYFGYGRSKGDTEAYRKAEARLMEFLADRARTVPISVRTSTASLAQVAEKYLQHLEECCRREEFSVSYFVRTRSSINEIVATLGATRRFADIHELDLEEYKTAALRCPVSEFTGRQISLATAKNRLDAVKSLYKWAYKNRLIDEQPRNLPDYTSFALPQPIVRVFTLPEVHRLWDAAPLRTKAFMVLALNCGFGQSDVSELLVKEVNLAAGAIEHPRVKTGVMCHHKLWPVTVDLLTRHRRENATEDERWFVTEGGGPLVWERLVDGKLHKGDAVKNAFWRLQQETKINCGRSFYSLRKTGATEIERIDPLVTPLYLGHSPREMKRFYALRNWDALHRVTDQLGGLFGLEVPAEGADP